MLHFLRKIRRSLIGSGNTQKPASPASGGHSLWRRLAGRYLLYAGGEIALVVIGILIALQINNWNTQSHLKSQEKSILNEIKRNIETNIIEANDDVLRITNHINSLDILVTHLRSELPFHDSLSSHRGAIFGGRFFNGVTSGYEVLKNQPEIALDDELRFALTTYFEESLYDVEHAMEGIGEFNNRYLSDYRLLYGRGGFDRIDFNAMRNDEMFNATLDLLRNNRSSRIRRLKGFQEQSEDILSKLQIYLEDEFGNQ